MSEWLENLSPIGYDAAGLYENKKYAEQGMSPDLTFMDMIEDFGEKKVKVTIEVLEDE